MNQLIQRMANFTCQEPGCEYTTGEVNAGAIGPLVTHHLQSAHPVAPPPKAPPFKAPEVELGIYEGQWKEFERSWATFLTTAKIPGPSQPAYLVSCCKPDLLSLVQREDPLISGKTVVQVMAAIRRLAVSGGSGNK